MIDWKQPAFFLELLVILTSSLVSVVVFRRFRIPDILAYLFAGAVIGPYALGLVKDDANIRLFSDLGVTFLLFDLGLEFSLPRLLALRRSVFGLGVLQLTLTIAVMSGVLIWFGGYSSAASLVIAGALTVSSTAIIVRELNELRLINRHHAQLSISVSILQDLAAVILLILIPALAVTPDQPVYRQIAWTLGSSLLLGGFLLGVARWVLPHVFYEITKIQSEEIFVLTTLVIVLLSGWLMSAFGLSMALGAFIIGVMLGESEFRHQVEMSIRPFRDILMGLFFASLGMKLDIGLLSGEWSMLLIGTALVVLGKWAITVASALIVGESFPTACKAGLLLAQVSEFGFALIALATEVGILATDTSSRVLLIAWATMVLSPVLIRYNFEISEALAGMAGQRFSARDRESEHVPPDLSDHVILAGYGRVGQMIGRFLRTNQIPFIAMDIDSEQVKKGRKDGELVIYGSCERIELLERCHIARARLAILTFKSLKEAQRAVSKIRSSGYALPIIVRTQHHSDYTGLIMAGANHVVPEMFEASLLIAAEVLTMLGFSKGEVEEQIDAERKRHRHLRWTSRLG
ncbi:MULTISPECIES: cation:proton antiporter [Methylocaldum]|jgi:CPA2 family monovalent cation:H+ antiporter-2|uniref:cation:proton antiporter n=1 Tax=unclassified Methylocaldum TaxID=2622260 RepID=UPI000A324A8D|nr:cation:proton antiporter [Methylocaldum sp. RMAD-M]MBP1148758.1 CPA2 family monovalent cation:H+ antiporter-2 [Methylocaldum sp. RMAD-M]MVF20774.1 sodium:proton exchanger [Methylocaldum sp. BRCS4]